MTIGSMNHPGRDLVKEIQEMAARGFDFIDLTLEPPMADVRRIDLRSVQDAVEESGLEVVGHTAYYLPLCSPFEMLRRAAVEELRLCLKAFATLGAQWMNIHPDNQAPFHERGFIIERNIQTIRELLVTAEDFGIGLMVENLPGGFNTARQLSELMDEVPELGLHLDIGHANLRVEHNTTEELLGAYGSRLKHVHLHDNKGGMLDLHLPLGTGNVDTALHLRSLNAAGYDGTITLEVFSPDRRHLDYSREVLLRLWAESAPETVSRSSPKKAAAMNR
jgi:sugar phosphate isomerase/epimerase